MTLTPAATSSAVTDACVTSDGSPETPAHTGSCPGASPNQTTILLESGRNWASVASLCSAYRFASGPSPPPDADQAPMAACAAAPLSSAGGMAASLWNALAPPFGKSLYWPAP